MRLEFERAAEERARALQGILRENLATLGFLQLLYVSSERVTRDEFKVFVEPALADHGEIHAFEWIPRVPASQREEFEHRIRSEGLSGFEIRSDGHGGEPRVIDEAIYPVVYAEPPERSAHEIGKDLGSDPVVAKAIERASRGQIALSERIWLGQGKSRRPLVRVFLPVFSRGSGEPLLAGFVSEILRVDAAIDRSFEILLPRGIDFAITDHSAALPNRLLHVQWWQPGGGALRSEHPRVFDEPAPLRYVSTFEVADRTWSVTFLPAPVFWRSWSSRDSWKILAIGLLATALLVANAHQIRKRASEVEELNDSLRRQAAQLEAANRELEAFSYSVSHDLRAPLRGIDGFSKALLEDYGDKLDTQARNYLDRVRAASQRMAQLIDDLLNLSRVARGEIRRETVDVSMMAETVLAELRRREPGRQVECIIPPGVAVEGDPRLLRIVLENLLANAWKFTSKKPQARIELGMARQNGEATYFIRDNGAGFDMAYASKLFGAFQRLHGAADFPGTGVGLATVQRIIHRHGGRVWAHGAAGEGATFWFTL